MLDHLATRRRITNLSLRFRGEQLGRPPEREMKHVEVADKAAGRKQLWRALSV
jgi:hypothetical protein